MKYTSQHDFALKIVHSIPTCPVMNGNSSISMTNKKAKKFAQCKACAALRYNKQDEKADHERVQAERLKSVIFRLDKRKHRRKMFYKLCPKCYKAMQYDAHQKDYYCINCIAKTIRARDK